jgi:tetratricopeptide (TPR) repeat protein
MTTFKQESATAEMTILRELYEAGEFQQALRQLGELNLLATLEERADDPELTGAALVIANLYRELGRFSPAESFYLQALAGLAHAPGKDHSEYACALVEFGRLYERLGRSDQALPLFEQARAVYEATAAPDPAAHSDCLQALAELYDDLDRRRDAQACLERARSLLEQAGAPPVEMAGLLLSEAWVLFRLRDSKDSISCARRALEIYREHKGDDHPATVLAGYRLGRLLLSVCQLDEAATLLERAVGIRRQRFGEETPRPALDLQALVTLRLLQGEPREAERLARRSVQLLRSTLGDCHPDVAEGYRTLGDVLRTERQLTGARECVEQALEIERILQGEGHSKVIELEFNLAELDEATGRHHDAVERLHGVLELLDRHPEDVRFEQVHGNLALARLLLEAGRLDEAEPRVAYARELAKDFPTTDPFLIGPALILAAQLRVARGDAGAAGKLLGQARQTLKDLPAHHPTVMEMNAVQLGLAELEGDIAGAIRLVREHARRVEQAGGERSPWLPATLCFLAETLYLSGAFEEAEQVYERALNIQRRRRGAEHPDLAAALRGLARLHLSRGNVAAAEVRFRQALEIRTNSLGEKHPDTAELLNDLAALLHQYGNLLAAEALFRQALEIRRACLGASHPETLTSQQGLAMVLGGRGETAEAADLLEKAVALTEPDHPQRFQLQHRLALAYNARGERARALELLRGVLSAQEKVLGSNHEALLPILADLSQMQVGLGDYLASRVLEERIRSLRAASPLPDPLGRALDLLTLSESHRLLGDAKHAWSLAGQALSMARDHLPPRDPGLVGYLTAFARACEATRAFSAARRHYREAMGLVLEAGGNRHPLVAALWADLACLEVAHGKPRNATPLYERSAELSRAASGEDHPDHAAARRVLGLHLQSQGQHDRAERELVRHLEIIRRSAGAEHPVVALAQQHLAELRRLRGDLPGAEADYRRALDLVRRSETPSDAVHANLLHGLAVVVRQQGRLDEAAGLLRNVLEIDGTSTGEDGLGNLNSLFELARVEAARGEEGAALEKLRRVLSAQDTLVAAYTCLPAGSGRNELLSAPWRLTEALLTLALRRREGVGPALEAVLRWKAFRPADLALEGRETLRRRHPALAKEIDRLFDLGMQIGGRLAQGAGQEGLQAHRDLLHRWGEEWRELEDQLAGALPVLARLRALRGVRGADVQKALPAGTTLVELVRFRPRDFAAECAGSDKQLPPHYLAFVVRSGEEDIALVDLGLAADLERRSGRELLGHALVGKLAGQQLIVAADGRLGRGVLGDCGGLGITAQELGSGRELIAPLLVPARPGWLGRLRAWFRG